MSVRWRVGGDVIGDISGVVSGDVDGKVGEDVIEATGCVPPVLLLLPPSECDVITIGLFIA